MRILAEISRHTELKRDQPWSGNRSSLKAAARTDHKSGLENPTHRKLTIQFRDFHDTRNVLPRFASCWKRKGVLPAIRLLKSHFITQHVVPTKGEVMKRRSVFWMLSILLTAILLLTGTSTKAAAQQICGNWTGSGLLGNNNQYEFKNDQWNSSFQGVSQCVTVTNSTAAPPGKGPSFSYTGSAFNDTTDTPATYPSFWYGCSYGTCTENTNLPIQMSQMSNWSVTSGVTVVEPSGNSNDCAYDIWFNQTPTTTGNPNGTELMIWVDHQGSPQPIGSVTGSFTSSGHTWTVWQGQGSFWNVISYVNNDSIGGGTTSPFDLNLNAFFADAESRGSIEASWYLMDIEYGNEIWVGGPGMQADNFWVNITSGSQPILSSISPAAAAVGSTVTLTGSNFGSSAGTVNFGSVSAAVSNWSNTSITAVVPSGVVVGANNVDVVTSANLTSNVVSFSIPADPISIDSGCLVAGSCTPPSGWVGDSFYTGGSTSTSTAAISTSLLSAPIPAQAVLQNQRYGAITYAIPGFTPSSTHSVTLYFAETYWTAAGDRQFNVSINNVKELSNFDIFKTAGGLNIAIAENFPNIAADSTGTITIAFAAGAADNPTVSGIAIDQNPTLTVALAGAGSGTVTSSPAGISCGTSCSAMFAAGTSVTLTATPASGSSFTGWSGACSGTSTCTVTLSAAATVTANFSTTALTVTPAGTGSGTVTSSPAGISCGTSCSSAFAAGTVVTLTATPASGSSFTGWSGACSGTAKTCSVTMNAAESVTATFASLTMPLTVVETGTGAGTVTSTPAGISCGATCNYAFTTGSTVSLAAVAASGSSFTGWGGACSGTGACTVTMSAAENVTANFSLPTQPLYIDAGGAASGSWVTDEDYSAGIESTYTNAVSTSLLTGVVPPQAILQSQRYNTSSFTYTIPGYTAGTTHTVTLYFVENYVTGSGQREFNAVINGTQVLTNFDVYAAAGGQFIAVQKSFTTTANTSGQIVIALNPGAIQNPMVSGIAIDAAAPSSYTLTIANAGTGSGTVTSSPTGISCGSTCSDAFTNGASVILTAAAASGSTFAGWSGACTGTATTCTVTMSAAESVTATFNSTTPVTALYINAGGTASGSFVADTDYSGGTAASTTAAINTSLIPLPAPAQSVFQTERWGAMTYTLPGYVAGSTHTVSLYFAETYWTAAGQREFNVFINGTQVLTNFDILAASGGQNIGIEENFTAVANSSGNIVIQFTVGAADQPKVSGIAVDQPLGVLSIDTGGAASGNFVADTDYSGGTASSTTAAINTTQLTGSVPPQAVLQTERWGASTYTIRGYSGYAPGSTHTVTLYFAEIYWTAAGQRQFNVSINGTQVLTNFDIVATAGGENIAVQKTFTTTANSNGEIVINFTVGAADQPKVSGIAIQ
jgi:hypothetical protein